MNDFHSLTFDVGTKNHLDYKALDLPQVTLEYNQKCKSAKKGARLGGGRKVSETCETCHSLKSNKSFFS